MKVTEEIATRYPKIKETVDYYVRKTAGPVFWEDNVGGSLSIVAAVPDKLTWEFEVKECHCNQYAFIITLNHLIFITFFIY
jgi:hypothetical protein